MMPSTRSARSAARACRAPRLLASLIALAALPMAPMLHAQASVPERAIDSLMARYASPDGPGASLLVVRDGQVVLAKGYALANLERHEPVTPETNFRLASLSKQFTATAIMLLVAEGKLRYDDALAVVLPLPALPGYARAVTVGQLLG